MANEIERKFLVINDDWRQNVDESIHIIQAYMGSNDKSSIRIRVNGDKANLNIKSKTIGIQRSEFDYPVPLDDAMDMLESLCDKPYIEKTRHLVKHEGHLWEIDEFAKENEGLIVAEIELSSTDESFSLPDWVGKDVSEETRYYNICLVTNPYSSWSDKP